MSLFRHRKKSGKTAAGRRPEDFRSMVLRVGARGSDRRLSKSRSLLIWALFIVFIGGFGVLSFLGIRFVGHSLFDENELFHVSSLDIKNGDVINRDLVMEYAGLNECSNLFGINIGTMREKLLLVPRVQSVEISRRMPGTLELRVTERVPIARIEMKGYFLSVDNDGFVLGPTKNATRLPVIVGHGMPGLRPGVDLKGTRVMEAIEVLFVCDTSPIGRGIRIAQLNVKGKEEVELQLVDGERVRLAWTGMGDRGPVGRANLEEKLNLVVCCLRNSSSRGKRLAWLDMRLDRNIPAQEY